jgi:hypothetical protein
MSQKLHDAEFSRSVERLPMVAFGREASPMLCPPTEGSERAR